MSGRLLSFSQYLQSADNVKVIELFPRSQKKFTYGYGADVTGYNFTADFQSLLIDKVTYDRTTGLPNFTESSIIGYYNNVTTINPSTYINESDITAGNIVFTIPENRYTGPLLPNARDNVVMTVVSFEWETNEIPPQKDSHRWAIIERWEPGVTVGDPQIDSSFIAIGVGAISTFTDNSATDTDRVAGTYTVTGLADGGSSGTGATFSVVVDANGVTTVNITARGTTYTAADTIKLLDSSMGGGGAADITVTVSTVA
jgi:hypothetical protein